MTRNEQVRLHPRDGSQARLQVGGRGAGSHGDGRAYMSLSELAFWAKITASAMERVHRSIADTTQCLKEI